MANTTSDTRNPSANVTTARLTPRVRNAGMANTNPIGMVNKMPARMANSTGTPARTIRPAISAPIPAKAH